jgi:hypothetical protein
LVQEQIHRRKKCALEGSLNSVSQVTTVFNSFQSTSSGEEHMKYREPVISMCLEESYRRIRAGSAMLDDDHAD